jgi:hypothetical protein
MLIVREPERLGKEIPMQRTGSILVVDREPTIVDLLVESLTDERYVACHLPALILLDMQMSDRAALS